MAPKKVPVTITYQKAGLQPPIFVAGTFSEPAWEPQEMDHVADQDGEQTFRKGIYVDEGSKIQYKFRLGLGDWWVLDEDAPTATDELGNRNNTMEVTDHEIDIPSQPTNVDKADEGRPKGEKESSQEVHKTGARGPVEALKQEFSIPRSGASTPGFVRTAAEVADSAALLDEEEPEPEISNEEAGRIGLRRLSSTPIPDVAQTAAEVADSAQLLDASNEYTAEDDDIIDPPAPLFAHERLGSPQGASAPGEDREGAPLFAYEYAGAYDNDKAPASSEGGHSPESHRSPERDYDVDDYDLKDPTLERFPSNREEILERVRSIETGLNEDHTAFDAVPPSPVVGPGRRSSNDFSAELLSASPSASPIIPRPSRRLEISRGSFGSPSAERSSSVASLHSIVEETAGDDDVDAEVPPVVLISAPSSRPTGLSKSPTSDEDEGVAIGIGDATTSPPEGEASSSGFLTPERAASPILPATQTEPVPDTSIPIAVLETRDLETARSLVEHESTTVVPESAIAQSPRIVVHRAEPSDTGRDTNRGDKANGTGPDTAESAADDNTDNYQDAEEVPEDLVLDGTAGPVVTPSATGPDQADGPSSRAPETDDTGSAAGTTRSSAVDAGMPGQLKKRTAPPVGERTATPTSIRSTGIDASKNGSWLKAFFKLVFVDWIGGFFRRLWSGKRKEMLAAAIAATASVILGAAWWRGPSRGSTE